jgi:predicted ATP-grasp superfamily ATP-dependent carboligase
VKPSRPLGKFKAVRVDDRQALSALIAAHPDTPVVIQEWIPGGDDNIHFCATVSLGGQPLCFFDGAKYLSHPPARGQTVVAGPAKTPALRSLLTRFISEAGLDGPVSLEAKLDPSGQYRIIEPTVGRTDFWANLAIVNGIDLPHVEYLSAVAPEKRPDTHLVSIPRVWFDSEKDPAAVIRLFPKISHDLRRPWLPSFSYFDLSDLRPYWSAIWKFVRRTGRYFRNRLA